VSWSLIVELAIAALCARPVNSSVGLLHMSEEKNMSHEIFDIILSPGYFKLGTSGDWELLTNSSARMLRNKRFIGGRWNGLDLSGYSFDRCGFVSASLIAFDFSAARFKGLTNAFSRCKCEGSNFSSTRFDRSGSSKSVFIDCSFIGSIWEKASCVDCLFYNCDLTGVGLDMSEPFSGTIFKSCSIPSDIAERLRTLKAVISD
jgi:uncharacterized protein YjbI with pentapeptide repeats